PTHHTTTGDLDLVDGGRVQREGALDAHAEGGLAHGERLPDSTAGACQHHTLEYLDTGAAALDDLHVHLHGVTGAELGDVVAKRFRVDAVQDVHGLNLPTAA